MCLVEAGLVLQYEAGVVRAVVTGPGGAGAAGVGRRRAGARQGRGGAVGTQPLRYLHRLKHAPRVVPARAMMSMKGLNYLDILITPSQSKHYFTNAHDTATILNKSQTGNMAIWEIKK